MLKYAFFCYHKVFSKNVVGCDRFSSFRIIIVAHFVEEVKRRSQTVCVRFLKYSLAFVDKMA